MEINSLYAYELIIYIYTFKRMCQVMWKLYCVDNAVSTREGVGVKDAGLKLCFIAVPDSYNPTMHTLYDKKYEKYILNNIERKRYAI